MEDEIEGMASFPMDPEIGYSGSLHYVDLLKAVMDALNQYVVQHDKPNAMRAMNLMWTLIQPFDLDDFMARSKAMGGASTVDAARQMFRLWSIEGEDVPDPGDGVFFTHPSDLVPEAERGPWGALDEVMDTFNRGVGALMVRLMPNVEIIEFRGED